MTRESIIKTIIGEYLYDMAMCPEPPPLARDPETLLPEHDTGEWHAWAALNTAAVRRIGAWYAAYRRGGVVDLTDEQQQLWHLLDHAPHTAHEDAAMAAAADYDRRGGDLGYACQTDDAPRSARLLRLLVASDDC